MDIPLRIFPPPYFYENNELNDEATCRNFRIVGTKGKREVESEVKRYNLLIIIFVHRDNLSPHKLSGFMKHFEEMKKGKPRRLLIM